MTAMQPPSISTIFQLVPAYTALMHVVIGPIETLTNVPSSTLLTTFSGSTAPFLLRCVNPSSQTLTRTATRPSVTTAALVPGVLELGIEAHFG